MKGLSFALFCGVVLMTLATPAMSHDCRVRDAYLRGSYEGDCDDRTEMAQGKGEAKGADTYVGDFVKGRPTGKGVYTWENGARLDGSFKEGKAHGPGSLRERQGRALRRTIRQRQAGRIEDRRLSFNAGAGQLLRLVVVFCGGNNSFLLVCSCFRSRRGGLGTLCPGTFGCPGVTTLGATIPGAGACPGGLVCASVDVRG